MTNATDVVIWSADVDEATLDRVLVHDLPLRLIKLDRLGLTRLPGSSADDQARVDTPFAAIAAGVNRVVIGRDLTNGDLSENFAKVDTNLNPTGGAK